MSALSPSSTATTARRLPAFARGPSSRPLLEDTVDASLARSVAAHPDRPAVVAAAGGERRSYGQLDEAVETPPVKFFGLSYFPPKKLGSGVGS